MTVESDADLASFFDAGEFAAAAIYVSPAAAVTPCTVIADRGQGRDPFRGRDVSVGIAQRHITVRDVETGEIESDGLFTVDVTDLDGVVTGTEQLKVVGQPKCDHTGRIWSVDVVLV